MTDNFPLLGAKKLSDYDDKVAGIIKDGLNNVVASGLNFAKDTMTSYVARLLLSASYDFTGSVCLLTRYSTGTPT